MWSNAHVSSDIGHGVAAAVNETSHGHFRGDIEGLRALAVTIVVLFHMGLDTFSGGFVGVDVFFVLSGFLITSLILREITTSGSLHLANFYARRARRLLPMAAITLAATALTARFVLYSVDRASLSGDVTSATLYFSNFHFGATQTNYMNQEAARSPLLHFWSLSVEEQFYLAWPFMAVLATARRGPLARLLHRWSPATRIAGLSGIIIVASAIASAKLTATQGPLAYYGIHTRAFELASGAFLAATITKLPVFKGLLVSLVGWAGIAAIGASAVIYGRSTQFPGTAAWIPVLGTIAILIGGRAHARLSPTSVLSSAPMRYVGKVSYAWYLTHWPAIVLVSYAVSNGGSRLAPWPWRIAAVAGSFVVAVAANRWFENPIRFAAPLVRRKLLTFAVAVLCSVGAIASGIAGQGNAAVDAGSLGIDSPRQHTYGCNVAHDDVALHTCMLGDPHGTKTIALFGDSHGAMLAAGLDELGRIRHWRILQLTKEGCFLAEVTIQHVFYQGSPYLQCNSWRLNALAYLRAHPVDIVISTRTGQSIERIFQGDAVLKGAAAREEYRRGFQAALTDLRGAAREILVFEDPPRAFQSMKDCVAAHPMPRNACDFSRAVGIHSDRELLGVEAAINDERLYFSDITDDICPKPRCPARMADGRLRYWDSNHFTDQYSFTLARIFGAAIDRATPRHLFKVP